MSNQPKDTAMALFSFRHNTKTFSPKARCDSRRARRGQTKAHIRYITRPKAARTVISDRLLPNALFEVADRAELDAERRGGRVCERFMIALPVEASEGQREALARAFCSHMTKGAAGYVAAVHDQNGNDLNNPHVHIVMFDAFIQNGGRGRPKSVIGMARKHAVENAARDWAKLHNEMMAGWGFGEESQIDHRSYRARGLARVATIHEGAGSIHAQRNGKSKAKNSDWQKVDEGHTRAEANAIIKQINSARKRIDEIERTDRLAGGHGSDRVGCDNLGKAHGKADRRDRANARGAAPPFVFSQGNASGVGRPPKRACPKQSAASTGATRSALPPFLSDQCSNSYLRGRRDVRRVFRDLIIARDSLLHQLKMLMRQHCLHGNDRAREHSAEVASSVVKHRNSNASIYR